MTITITAFERSPRAARALARDTRVRWALDEVNQPRLQARVRGAGGDQYPAGKLT